jgi:lactoylglutathione lyase
MPTDASNVKQAVPFFNVTDIDASLRFYVDGFGSVLTNQWVPEGRVRWCWLELGDAAVMLQEYWRDGRRRDPWVKASRFVSCGLTLWPSTTT